MPARDVAIYMPSAKWAYQRGWGRVGGAERQTVLLARALSEHGLDVAHLVGPVPDPVDGLPYEIQQRAPARRGRLGKLLEPRHVWASVARADARCYVMRMATPAVGVVAAFCRRNDRRFIWAAASDGDFTLDTIEGPPGSGELFVRGLRGVDTVVAQSGQQVDLARERFPWLERVVEIPSFVEPQPPADAPADAFLWVGRLVDYKQPERYLDLAEAMPEARFRMIAPPDVTPSAVSQDALARAATLDNLEILAPQPHTTVLDLVGRAPAVVSTSRMEGMPNIFLEAWSRGVPALSLQFDPDDRIARHGLGIAAGASWDDFLAAARQLWEQRADRGGYGEVTRAYVQRVHGSAVAEAWAGLMAERPASP